MFAGYTRAIRSYVRVCYRDNDPQPFMKSPGTISFVAVTVVLVGAKKRESERGHLQNLEARSPSKFRPSSGDDTTRFSAPDALERTCERV